MFFRISARTLFTRIFGVIIVSGFVGYLFGQTFLAVSIVSLCLLAWHYNHLFKLIQWLWQGKSIAPPQANGIWGRIYDGLYRRIRKQRLKQKQLNERIRKFRDGAEALPDAALVLSNELIILWGNKKASKFLGVRWPEDIGLRIDNLIRFPEFSKYLDDGDYNSPCLIISPINNELQLELRMMAYGSDQILLLARDISKIQRLEEMRRDFVANVSHELKTPLTVVRGYVEMVQASETALDPHWKKAFTTIESQVSRMDRLVEQLLVLSRIEHNVDADNHQEVNLSRLVLTIIEEVQWLNQDKNHIINNDIAPNISINGNEHELKSACLNLISNAIAYTPPNGIIDIRLGNDGNKIRFSVKDNGPGIKPEHVNRLTERFFRVDKSRSRNTGGSGLGLAIVKHVLNHHHGELSIESEWHQGSEFIIYFSPEIANK
ncbi:MULTISPECIES: phosphate regulon sensor histidine kinase PhoR [unclassified Colwellia]|uniref:phosphate regulon sensor histidine kinase PhoR n=1 Tax=unclassified Colwellia TaxID=196834 RepID=UPI0015F7775A|nr:MULTISPECIES: phosphate regulon sensor histidine kinase PhoR [unclassified Colwellia]MBA6223273.1 phosphate regulon sensor histidine kinase PhoR [Colwellia sp. MB3u-45]MBA6266417.1 phosphate regulon sensor histidine kinase PhoR [Colwellia sp. MB3u-43]MBA6289198.1 phosphate regulon sensor histidine kinase PhoR [Colwellia sp. MB3u-4]MBA6322432.1 phosphate regulon sensor histidine kinase PhoR [Colwellia sp. MB02u-19]MBA6324431.1 phosphate regulon sensor histidine kinase PhoR [Colwellia sp. MB0